MDILSTAIVGFIYTLLVTLVTLSNKSIYEDKIKEKLKNSNNQRWAVTLILYLFLCFIMPPLFFMFFWNNLPYSSRTESFGLTLNIAAIVLSAIIAHLAYIFMRNLTIRAAK